MIINKLKLKNFKSYEDETIFNFSPNKDRNIILIGGENGAGKSSIFESIKLCIYGPAAYQYQGINSTYINRIKSLINHNAYSAKNIDSFISLEISLVEDTIINNYIIERKWTFIDKKLSEIYTVYKNGVKLTDSELTYFENYLKSIIPPKMFEFFFFDGEHLSDFFIGKNYKAHLKESLLSLCNFDNFEILRKQLIYNQRNSSSQVEGIKELQDKYDLESLKLKNIIEKIESIERAIKEINLDLENLDIKQKNLEKDFREAGGLLASERDSILSSMNLLDNKRSQINQHIKDFCNEMLPFLIVVDMLPSIKGQIELEDDYLAYKKVKSKLSGTLISSILSSSLPNNQNIDDEIAVTIADQISKHMFPSSINDDFELLHNLSPDQRNEVISLINKIFTYMPSETLSYFDELTEINQNVKVLRDRLNSNVSEELLNEYVKNSNKIASSISQAQQKKGSLIQELDNLLIERSKIETLVEKSKNIYMDALQSENILGISGNVTDMLEELINTITREKLDEVEKHFMDIFKSILRKDRYIDAIEIEDDFTVILYVKKWYNSFDVLNLLNNIGYDEMTRKLGDKFFEDLMVHYNVRTKAELIDSINNDQQINMIELNTKVNVDDFSSGEKQIYILCLYWSLVKASGIQVPFIIDTPYARIDDTHRNAITTKYLPNISKQVIVLSTNTEIDVNSYNQIKEFISNEYLLQYLDKERKTIVHDRYFFEV